MVMAGGTRVVVSVGADTMGASGVTMVVAMVVRAVVRTTTGTAVTPTSPRNNSRGDIVGGIS
jgi:hypothetical protein